MTWRQDWAREIREMTKDLPEDMPLADRIKAVDEIKDLWPSAYSTSWGKKVLASRTARLPGPFWISGQDQESEGGSILSATIRWFVVAAVENQQ